MRVCLLSLSQLLSSLSLPLCLSPVLSPRLSLHPLFSVLSLLTVYFCRGSAFPPLKRSNTQTVRACASSLGVTISFYVPFVPSTFTPPPPFALYCCIQSLFALAAAVLCTHTDLSIPRPIFYSWECAQSPISNFDRFHC